MGLLQRIGSEFSRVGHQMDDAFHGEGGAGLFGNPVAYGKNRWGGKPREVITKPWEELGRMGENAYDWGEQNVFRGRGPSWARRYREHMSAGPLGGYAGEYFTDRRHGESVGDATRSGVDNLGTSAAIMAAAYLGGEAYGAVGEGGSGAAAGGSEAGAGEVVVGAGGGTSAGGITTTPMATSEGAVGTPVESGGMSLMDYARKGYNYYNRGKQLMNLFNGGGSGAGGGGGAGRGYPFSMDPGSDGGGEKEFFAEQLMKLYHPSGQQSEPAVNDFSPLLSEFGLTSDDIGALYGG